ncbi:CotH kinase family protein [Horticoccus sp. 23ND18S-11]|uniref:CotH kinase family protein n=1 Tax=Horticoccus sp. 23ND18S-11 TaxID=3391832 RepID=UPI0039C95765
MARFLLPRRDVVAALLLSCVVPGAFADPVISEFLALNSASLADSDGDFSDWIELHNPDAAAVSLDGWYLTDNAGNKEKWKLPAVTIAPGGYLVVFASDKNRRDPALPLHTNFALEGGGEYLALIKPDGTVASEFAPKFPAQYPNVSFGVTQPTVAGEAAQTGFFRTPTPGARNGGAATLLPLERVAFSRVSGPFTGSFSLTLGGASAGQRIRYTVTPATAAGLVAPEPTATSPEYIGPIPISASSVVRATVFSADNSQRGFPSTAHYPRIANSGAVRLDTFTSQLPVLVMDTHGTGDLDKAAGEKPVWIYTWNRPAAGNTPLAAAPSLASSGATNVRGSSSANFPKKSYTLHLDDANGHDNALPLFGLTAFDTWTLVGPWSYDRTYIHNVFTYALSNRIGRWAPRTQLVEVFINANGGDIDSQDYAGIYVLTDAVRVDPERVAITPIETSDTGTKSVTGGYLLKVDLPDSEEFGFTTTRSYPGEPSVIGIVTPKLNALPKAQREYVQGYVQGFEDALVADWSGGFQQRTYGDFIERGSWVDHHLLNVLTSNVDAFFRSAYLTKDREGRLQAGPMWDNDRAMDGGEDRSKRPDVWNGSDGATPFWEYGWWGYLGRDPEFVQAWIDRWHGLRQSELSIASLTSLVDGIAAQIGGAAAARDAARWPENASKVGGTWQGEIDHMKTWLSRRVAWIDEQFPPPPSLVVTGGTLTLTPVPGTQIAYTVNGTDPRAVGGRVSLAAQLTSTAVTLASSAEVHARTYRADYDAAKLPSSGWSAPVSGPAATTLSPAPRLSNLSSRGFVGAGENVMITGVVVNDTAGKRYLARGVGPTLASFGVGGALASPVLTIIDAAGREVAKNSDWQKGSGSDDIPDVTKAVGAFPLSKTSKDAAILATLPRGNYTLRVSSADTSTGVALVELYEVDSDVGRTLNLSTRGLVRAGEGLLIGGVVVRGPGPKQLLIRAIGPTLGSFGVGATLADPVLTIYSGDKVIASNDDWSTPAAGGATSAAIATSAAAVGAFALPTGSRDAAMLITLPAGGYTLQVTGKANGEGVILLEVYEVL